MKLACLSKGDGFYFPPCHVLTISGFRVLMEFPLDLSALTIFAPRLADSRRPSNGRSFDEVDGFSDVPLKVYKRRRTEKSLEASDLIKAVPWYKTVLSLEALDVASIDVVLISSPMGMLGLPFLTQSKDFSAKIYATEVTARFGKLMMEELVSMHGEFQQFYGCNDLKSPHWMEHEALELLHPALRSTLTGKDFVGLSTWQCLYSAADVKDCMRIVNMLKYAEEVCHNGLLILKPCSSGLEIGTCNWLIQGPRGIVAYLASSIVGSSYAAEFDYRSLQGNDITFFSDFSCSLYSNSSPLTPLDTCSPTNSSAVREIHNKEKLVASLNGYDDIAEEAGKIDFICSAALQSIIEGGSVLIPLGRLGIILQLLEQITMTLESANLKIPIFMISTAAEEIMSVASVIPEWLSKSRQEKLYAGEPLFGHLELIKEKKLQLFPGTYSSKLINAWQEPCIIFCPHWSLRLGPAVHILRRWCGNSKSLLVLEEGIDAKLALLPFGRVEMKVLLCSFLSGLKAHTIEPLLQILQPKLVLVPEDLRSKLFDTHLKDSSTFLFYSEKQTLRVPNLRESCEADLETDLAFQLKPRKLRQDNMAIARLRGELHVTNGKYLLVSLNDPTDSSCQQLLCWGSVDAGKLLQALVEKGIKGCVESGGNVGNPYCIIRIEGSNSAFVEIGKTETVIAAADAVLASHLVQAVESMLDCI